MKLIEAHMYLVDEVPSVYLGIDADNNHLFIPSKPNSMINKVHTSEENRLKLITALSSNLQKKIAHAVYVFYTNVPSDNIVNTFTPTQLRRMGHVGYTFVCRNIENEIYGIECNIGGEVLYIGFAPEDFGNNSQWSKINWNGAFTNNTLANQTYILWEGEGYHERFSDFETMKRKYASIFSKFNIQKPYNDR